MEKMTYREGVNFCRELQDIYTPQQLRHILTNDFGWTRQRALTVIYEALGKV